MKSKKATKIEMAARDRTYHVAMHALSEEHRVMHLSPEELSRRQHDIWDSSFGDLPENVAYREKMKGTP